MLKRIPIIWKLSSAFVVILLLLFVTLRGLVAAPDLPLLAAFALALLLGVGATWLLVDRCINRSIKRVTDGMNELAEKNFDFRLAEDEKSEFGPLASSFNDMADMLSSSLTELKKNRDYLEGILESSADIIITVNASGKIQTINSGAEHALGYHRLEVIGKSVEVLFTDPQERKVMAQKLQYAESVVNYETQLLAKNGAVRDVMLTLSRLRNPTGAIIGTIGIGKDITEEKQLQAQLIQSRRFAAIGQVFTGIQHSMKNMLNACKGGAYMVKTGLAKDDRKMLTEGWDIVQVGITGLTKMSLDMLKYVKDFKPTVNRVDLSETLTEIYQVIRQTAQDKGVDIQLQLPSSLPAVVCDARMVHSAAMDIVSNAVDACLWKEYHGDEKPRVTLRAYPSPEAAELVIEVRDNGCGMTDEVKSHIFTPFFSTKSKAGTGLGLSIASRMINVHGGRIEVESEPDNGAMFRIMLPVDGKNKEGIHGKKSAGG
jgi:two-component system sensor histidine kinase AtoS